MKKDGLRNETMNESDSTIIIKMKIYPRDSEITMHHGFVNIDNGEQGGTHWISFCVKANKVSYFDSFGEPPDKVSLQKLLKTFAFQNFKNQNNSSRLCGTHCLYFLYRSQNGSSRCCFEIIFQLK